MGVKVKKNNKHPLLDIKWPEDMMGDDGGKLLLTDPGVIMSKCLLRGKLQGRHFLILGIRKSEGMVLVVSIASRVFVDIYSFIIYINGKQEVIYE